MIKPKRLMKGDTVAFIAPASGLAALVPHRLEKARQFFESEGFIVKVYPTAKKNSGLSSDTPKNRAKDINDAFSDPDVKAIVTTIGGNSAHQTLEFIDFDNIKRNPKIFCGYSDITSLHLAFFKKANLVVFYGPAAVTQFGEYPKPDDYTLDYFWKATMHQKSIGQIAPSEEWTDDKDGNWFEKKDLTHKRKRVKNNGYVWLKKGVASGEILGGCITTMMHLRGTDYWPDFNGKILLLETPEGEDFRKGEPVSNINAYLADLRISGVFGKIKGIVFGRGFGYTQKDIQDLQASILENVRDYDFPILYGIDIGHTDPMLTIPIGVRVTIDSENNSLEIKESGVE